VNFRFRLAAWFALCVLILGGVLIFTAHQHLDEELRKDRWDRSHPKFPNWVIHGSYTDEEVQEILGELLQVWVWVGVPLLAVSLAIGYFIAIRSVRPIRRINHELSALDPQSLSRGISLPEKDAELATLVRHINELLVRVARSYNDMAEFSATVAHELRTPLTLLRMRVEAAAAELPPEFSEDVQEEIRHLSLLVERSLLAAKAEGGRLEVRNASVDLSTLAAEFNDAYSVLAAERSIALDWRIEPGLQLHTDTDLLRQILHNLIGNAFRHGTETMRLRMRRSPRSQHVVITISNFIKSESSRQPGTGIGLRLVHSLVAALGGSTFHTRQTTHAYSIRLVFKHNPIPTHQ